MKKPQDRDRHLGSGLGATITEPAPDLLRSRSIRWPPQWIANLDTLPTPGLVAMGLIPAAGLAWLASHSLVATAVLVLLMIPIAAIWQGRRLRVIWPEEFKEAPVEPPPKPQPPPQPPYPVQDPLIELMALPGGRFWMGSDKALDPQAYDDEFPRREVRISPFAITRAPITRGLYRKLTSSAPSEWKEDKDDWPANYLSWEDAVRFCNALSKQSGRTPCYRATDRGWKCDWQVDGYRLPTEAEWEYACRAGSETPWFWGEEKNDAGSYAWFLGNSAYMPQPVGKRKSNPWGLYDMAGLVWEWCWDWYAETYDTRDLDNPRGPAKGWRRVLRGGSFFREPRNLRSADRFRFEPGHRSGDIGFRCVRGSGRQLDH